MLQFADALEVPAHVLLSKSDKLKRGQASRALLTARKELGSTAGVQLFSARSGEGLEEARSCLMKMLACEEGRAGISGD